MTLDEAIAHLDEKLDNDDFPCEACRQEHIQLRTWLSELRSRRWGGRMTNAEAINDLKEFWNWFCCTYPNSPYADERIDYAFGMAFDALERCEDVDPYLARWSEVKE